MSSLVKEAVDLLEVLPAEDQSFALAIIKKLVLAWDPDFTRLTSKERRELDGAREDEETIPHDMINWD